MTGSVILNVYDNSSSVFIYYLFFRFVIFGHCLYNLLWVFYISLILYILCDFHQYFVVHRFHKYVLCQINVKFLWSGLFLQTVVQTIVGLNTGPEVYMSAKACINWPSPHFHCSLTMLKYMWLGNASCQLLCAQICESFHWSFICS